LSLSGWVPKGEACPERSDLSRIKEMKRKKIAPQIERILDLIFGNPFITPTFDEYAMFMAYSSALRSADLSRQVGAVITTKYKEIIATGANDVPFYGGGQYWPLDVKENDHWDSEGGRDYRIGFDPNKKEYANIVKEIVAPMSLNKLETESDMEYEKRLTETKKMIKKYILSSRIKELTEYGRSVHAEMAAMLSCARTGASLQGATLYCTTFPCHNCARHVIYSGIERVIFIEPYPKSKAFDLHKDSIFLDSISSGDDENREKRKKVIFQQFTGIGPRRFIDLFSMNLSTGRNIQRKQEDGITAVTWNRNDASLRCHLDHYHCEKQEQVAATNYSDFCEFLDSS
jgi:deoxycytidylate deaminase